MNHSFTKYLTAILIVAGLSLISCKSSKKIQSPEISQREKELKEMEYLHYFLEGHRLKLMGYLGESLAAYQKCLGIKPQSATIHYEIASLYVFNNQLEDARFYAEKAAEFDPRNKWAQLLHAGLLIQNNKWKDAALVYEQILSIDDNIDYKLDLAEIYSMNPKASKKAMNLYNEIENEWGVIEYVSLNKHKLLKTKGDNENAMEELRKLAISYPDEIKFSLLYAEELVRFNRMIEAESWYNQAISNHPNHGVLSLSYASFLMLNKKYKASIPYYRIALKDVDLNYALKREALALLYDYYYNETNRNEVIELVEIVNDLHPDESEDKIVRALIFMDEGNWTQARVLIQNQIEDAKVNQELVNLALHISLQLDDNELLYQDAKTAVGLFPLYANYYVLLGQACLFTKRYNEGIESLTEGLVYAIGDTALLSDFYMFLGELYNRTEYHIESDRAFEKSISLNPNNPYTLNNYSYYLALRKENLNRALELSKLSIALQKDNEAFTHTFGWINYQLESYTEAEKYIQLAIELSKEDKPLFWEHLGDIKCKLGKTEEAKKAWTKALELSKEKELLNEKIKTGECP